MTSPARRYALALLAALSVTACSKSSRPGSPFEPSPPPPDPIVIEGNQNACISVRESTRDLYAMWRVRSADNRERAFEAVAYRDAAPGCAATNADPLRLPPLWSPSGTEATFYLAPAIPTCGRAYLVLRVDGVQKTTMTIDSGIACG